MRARRPPKLNIQTEIHLISQSDNIRDDNEAITIQKAGRIFLFIVGFGTQNSLINSNCPTRVTAVKNTCESFPDRTVKSERNIKLSKEV